MVVYIVILFYKCLCSKNYEQWRRKWSTVNIKRQYNLIHTKKKRKQSHHKKSECSSNDEINEDDDDDDDEECVTTSCEEACSSFNSDNHEESENETMNRQGTIKKKSTENRREAFNVEENEDLLPSNQVHSTRQQHVVKSTKYSKKDELINKIINGQKNNIDLEPYKIFNFDPLTKHAYPIDSVACGNSLFASSDLANSIRVWSLLPSNKNVTQHLIKSIDLKSQTAESVWSMCFSYDDKFMFVGQSNGTLRAIDLSPATNPFYALPSWIINKNGITNLIQVKANLSTPLEIGYLVLVARLDGTLELV